MSGDLFDLHISIRDCDPPIWRSVRLPARATLGALHNIIQIVFGWENSHLHDFRVGEVRFGMVDIEDEMFTVNENAAPLGALARQDSRFVYCYDFGDDWEHDILVTRVGAGEDNSFVCTGGARACPPEDCGGTPGYEQLVKVLADPKHEEYADMKRWVGRNFDPEKFDIAAVNRKLKTLSKRSGYGAKAR